MKGELYKTLLRIGNRWRNQGGGVSSNLAPPFHPRNSHLAIMYSSKLVQVVGESDAGRLYEHCILSTFLLNGAGGKYSTIL